MENSITYYNSIYGLVKTFNICMCPMIVRVSFVVAFNFRLTRDYSE